jgi:hypothetical protein
MVGMLRRAIGLEELMVNATPAWTSATSVPFAALHSPSLSASARSGG